MFTDSGSSDQDSNVMPRKLGEVIGSTVGAVAQVVVNYPLGMYMMSCGDVF